MRVTSGVIGWEYGLKPYLGLSRRPSREQLEHELGIQHFERLLHRGMQAIGDGRPTTSLGVNLASASDRSYNLAYKSRISTRSSTLRTFGRQLRVCLNFVTKSSRLIFFT